MCCSPRGRKELNPTEQLNWLNLTALHSYSFTVWFIPVLVHELSHDMCTGSERKHLEMLRQSAIKSQHVILYFTKQRFAIVWGRGHQRLLSWSIAFSCSVAFAYLFVFRRVCASLFWGSSVSVLIWNLNMCVMGFPGGSDGQQSACDAGDLD